MECEEFILPDWSPPDNPIQSKRAKRASSSIMEFEEFILPDWSPPDDPARPCRPKAGYGIVMVMTTSIRPAFHFSGLLFWGSPGEKLILQNTKKITGDLDYFDFEQR